MRFKHMTHEQHCNIFVFVLANQRNSVRSITRFSTERERFNIMILYKEMAFNMFIQKNTFQPLRNTLAQLCAELYVERDYFCFRFSVASSVIFADSDTATLKENNDCV